MAKDTPSLQAALESLFGTALGQSASCPAARACSGPATIRIIFICCAPAVWAFFAMMRIMTN